MRRHAVLASLIVFAAVLCVGRPASAQVVDLSGVWAPLMHEDAPERAAGPEVGDYLGLPITDAARKIAQQYDADEFEMPELMCRPFMATYAPRAISTTSCPAICSFAPIVPPIAPAP